MEMSKALNLIPITKLKTVPPTFLLLFFFLAPEILNSIGSNCRVTALAVINAHFGSVSLFKP